MFAPMKITVNHPNELEHAAAEILQNFANYRIFLLYGEMGAGKTTLVNALCRALGVTDPTSSPTFSIVNEYQGKEHSIYHFDFYRLKEEEEALDMGYEDYFYTDAYCFIEWPEKIPNLLPEDALKINIEVLSPTSRNLSITALQ